MGVSGSGKTTVGKALAAALGWPFIDGDDYHPGANREKMARGQPLTDTDRIPWLDHLHDLITAQFAEGRSLVVACSALKRSYRDLLRGADKLVQFVYLKGDYELIRARLVKRSDHFMKAGMLENQFATLEEPREALVVDVKKSVNDMVDEIQKELEFS